MMVDPIHVLNGPNLDRLGLREPGIYGSVTLVDIEQRCRARAGDLGRSLEFRQTNHEGTLVEWVHEAADARAGLVINAGAYTHTSLALHDALRAAGAPIIEVHLSNIHAREVVRHHSYVAPLALGTICGFGAAGYEMALDALHRHMKTNRDAAE